MSAYTEKVAIQIVQKQQLENATCSKWNIDDQVMYFEMMLTDLCSASCYVQGDITPFPVLQFHHQPILV